MQVFDEITNKLRDANRCTRVIVKHIPGYLVYGYSSDSDSIITFLAFNGMRYDLFRGDKNLLKDVLVFSTKRGCYVSTVDFPKGALLKEVYTKGSGEFPYNFAKRYEAIENFNIFNGRQQVVDPKNYNIAKYLKYSFGLEFETSMGYVPEDLCFRDGLIPLRDGSITGLEYSTVVLEGNTGLCLLNQQIKTLKRYTAFNKECSLHMHFGGFPLTPEYLYRVYKLCKGLEDQIRELVPPLTFNSAEYKDNGKDYCKCLKPYRSFNHMYENLVGRQFFGSLTQPHPNDVKREAKWRIPTRRK